MSIFESRLTHVRCKSWKTEELGERFPELHDPEVAVPGLDRRPATGVAFSGGGTRSAAATLGQLRALHHLGLLSKLRYVSCVSGGSWAAVPFTFLPSDWTDETFLGPVLAPGEITLDRLQNLDRNSFAHAVANSEVFDDFLEHAARFAGDETYARAIGDVFLERFGIDNFRRLFTQDERSRAAIRGRNARARDEDFYLTRPGRPFLIAGCTVLRLENPAGRASKIHFEITPLYAGSRVLHSGAGSQGLPIGGGYVESFAMDSDAPVRNPDGTGVARVRLGRKRFTLSDKIGASGAAPSEVLERIGLDFLGFPEFKYWSPTARTAAQRRAKEYTFGDGGHLENLGVMPLLMRGVERLVLFVNTKHALNRQDPEAINGSIPPLFGRTPGFPENHVFPSERFDELLEALHRKRFDEQGPVVHRAEYTLLDNAHYGIRGGRRVQVLWVYNERVPRWESELPGDIRSMIGAGSLGNFPHYRTFFQNPPKVIDLSTKQVSMLSHLACWSVLDQAKEFTDLLAP